MSVTIEAEQEKILPWYSIEPEYQMFQYRAWEHPETAHQLTVESMPGPHNGDPHFQILLLRYEPEGTDDMLAVLEDGFDDVDHAVLEAEAYMVAGTVYDEVDV
jgi:hypothetical protein